MKNPLNLYLLRKSVSDAIRFMPLHIQTWVLVSGDGLVSDNSWAFGNSWVGTWGALGREVFRAFARDIGNVGEKNYVLLLPYQAGKVTPKRGDELRVYDMAGNEIGRFFCNFVATYDAGTEGVGADTTWKIECHVVRLEG